MDLLAHVRHPRHGAAKRLTIIVSQPGFQLTCDVVTANLKLMFP